MSVAAQFIIMACITQSLSILSKNRFPPREKRRKILLLIKRTQRRFIRQRRLERNNRRARAAATTTTAAVAEAVSIQDLKMSPRSPPPLPPSPLFCSPLSSPELQVPRAGGSPLAQTLPPTPDPFHLRRRFRSAEEREMQLDPADMEPENTL